MITQQKFDTYMGREITAYLLSDKIDVLVCNLGATILSIKVPDSNGSKVDVALNMTNVQDMLDHGDYMGAVVGRCGNRIEDGRFTLNGVTYQLAKNDHGVAHLHGADWASSVSLPYATPSRAAPLQSITTAKATRILCLTPPITLILILTARMTEAYSTTCCKFAPTAIWK